MCNSASGTRFLSLRLGDSLAVCSELGSRCARLADLADQVIKINTGSAGVQVEHGPVERKRIPLLGEQARDELLQRLQVRMPGCRSPDRARCAKRSARTGPGA